MNIERIPERLTKWVVILVGFFLAIYLGRQAGNGQYGTIALVMLILGIGGMALAIPDRLWMAVPVAWPLVGQIPVLALPATVRDLIVVAVFLIFLPLIAFKVIRRKPQMELIDLLAWLTIVYLIIAFIRNPVGAAAIDSERIGGRPYFTVMIGFLAYWIISRSAIPLSSSKGYSVMFTFAKTIESIMAQLLVWVPPLVALITMYYITPTFTWAVDPDALPAEPGAESTGRVGYLAFAGVPIAVYVLTRYRPLSCAIPRNYWRGFFLTLGIASILASGFRSALVFVAGVGFVSSYLHGGKADVWRLAGIAIVTALFLAMLQGTVVNLPRSAQRALSFLPGNWDKYALEEAQESTKWRLEMWEQMLTSNKYIDNRLLGDGFGFKRIDLQRMQAKRALGLQMDQEDFMAAGGVHSGPISAVRYAGYLGLVLHLCFLGFAARMAWQLIHQARGNAWQGLVFLICIPAIVEPFFFVFIFGAYENSVPDTLFLTGMLKMLKNSMAETSGKVEAPELLFPAMDAFNAEKEHGQISKS